MMSNLAVAWLGVEGEGSYIEESSHGFLMVYHMTLSVNVVKPPKYPKVLYNFQPTFFPNREEGLQKNVEVHFNWFFKRLFSEI